MIKKHTLPIVTLSLVVGIVVYLTLWDSAFVTQYGDVQRLETAVRSFGMWAPVIFVLFQALQVFIAPIPGQFTCIVGGFLFGALAGTVYAMIGAMIGSYCVFRLVRVYGLPLVRRMVKGNVIAKFDRLAKTSGTQVLFLAYLLPAIPDDAISFVAGLSPISTKKLMLVSVAGRLPGYFALAYAGSLMAGGEDLHAFAAIGVLLAIFCFAYFKRATIERYVCG